MDWGDFLNQTAQEYVYAEVMPEATIMQGNPPTVATNPATGGSYVEGKPATSGIGGMLSNPLVMIGGAVALGLVVWLAVRK